MLEPVTFVETLKCKPERNLVILTGRDGHPTIIELPDPITEMKQVKHA